ncbi:MAG TPA: DUF3459 domain-containing protein, partial [Thermoanaerobaculia bacterium]|nr:DUF3459 domain-containing protein [Thermoanaerobaculia bacterium]
RKYGLRPRTTDGAKFVVCAQNHDQVGNRMMGERLAALVSIDKVRLAAAVIVLSPFVPMLFMGEEYGELAPWQYFTSHNDADLIEAVRRGRLEEFDDFDWEGDPPAPDDEATFFRSKLNWSLLERAEHASLWRFYRELLHLRRDVPALRTLDLARVETHADDERRTLIVRRDDILLGFNFSEKTQTLALPFDGAWNALIDTGGKIEEGAITLPPLAFGVWSGAIAGPR